MKNKVTSFSTLKKSDKSLIVFWFRRDIRLIDNHGLFEALKQQHSVLPIFIFDTHILSKLEDNDSRVSFIHSELSQLQKRLESNGGRMAIFLGEPKHVFESLIEDHSIQAVYTNEDYEPYALQRDQDIADLLSSNGVEFKQFKDHVIFHKNDILKDDGSPYRVYTPYSKRWKLQYQTTQIDHSYPSEQYLSNLTTEEDFEITHFPSLKEIGFVQGRFIAPSKKISTDRISNYHNTRDIPSIDGTSRLSVHLRFGTISVRELVRFAFYRNEKYLNELIWREFYSMILFHYPYVVDGPFKKEYGVLKWRNNEEEFERWKEGNTGIPMVDAGVRELNATGFMHNRVRMIAASFLCKNLLINWQWGEQYFADKLMDFELASNNGGWQWVAGTGTDASPYFRVFNPMTQQKKFDPNGEYVKKWVPEIDSLDYPAPMVDLKASRLRCLETYKGVK